MNTELTKQLIEKFPQLYIHPKWGDIMFEHNDGWYDLILNLSFEIEKSVNDSADRIWPIAVQVKEKFGGLRFYVDHSNNDIDKIISKYESLSEQTCEICGKLGKRQSVRGWLATLCDDHYKECLSE